MTFQIDRSAVSSANKISSKAKTFKTSDQFIFATVGGIFYEEGLKVTTIRSNKTVELLKNKDYFLYGEVLGIVAENGSKAYTAVVVTKAANAPGGVFVEAQMVGGVSGYFSEIGRFYRKNKNTNAIPFITDAYKNPLSFKSLSDPEIETLALTQEDIASPIISRNSEIKTDGKTFRELGGMVAAFYYGEWRRHGVSYNRFPWKRIANNTDRLPIPSIQLRCNQQWNFDNGIWGWNAGNSATLSPNGTTNFNTADWSGWVVSNGTSLLSGSDIEIASTTADSFITSPDNLNIPAENIKKLVVGLKLKDLTQEDWDGRVYFQTNSDPTWTESKTLTFSRVPNSDGEVVRQIDPSKNVRFSGVIKRLRFDFTKTPGKKIIITRLGYRTGSMRLTSQSTDPILYSPDYMNLKGGNYSGFKFKVRKVSGTAWDGRCFFITNDDTVWEGTEKHKTIAQPDWSDGTFKEITVDLSDKAKWNSGTVRQIRIDLGADATSVYDIESFELITSSDLEKYKEDQVFGLPSDAEWSVDWELRQAKQHGIDVFIHNFYWGSAEAAATDGANMQRYSLELHAASIASPDMKFALQWSNHDSANPISVRAKFEALLDEWYRYFGNSRYWRIDGKPVVYIFSAGKLMEHAAGLFGITNDRFALKRIIEEADTYIKNKPNSYAPNGIYWVSGSGSDHPYWTGRKHGWVGANEFAGFSASSAYNFFQSATGQTQTASGGSVSGNWPETLSSFQQLSQVYKNRAEWVVKESGSRLPYHSPAISGWDQRPWWTNGNDSLQERDQCSASPYEFHEHLKQSVYYAIESSILNGNSPVVTICAWNEYGEGSFIAPTRRYGWSLLEAILKATT